MRGKVKFFNDKKGFGFITIDGTQEDVFVHFSAIEVDGFRKLRQDQIVEFEVVEEDGKKRAEKVRPIEE